MNSATTSAAGFRPPPPPPNSSLPKPQRNQYNPTHSNHPNISTKSIKISRKPDNTTNVIQVSYLKTVPISYTTPLTFPEKLDILIKEFKSLPEPIDRVKRLIHYAGLLPQFNESDRTESNRITGCTAQVWLETTMDDERLMRFRVDSDSEITKGFCYCLIWLLDGASPSDVMEMRVDDLWEMNVGILPVRTSSRVNTWHNVLISMQRRTRDLVDCSSFSLLR